MSEDILHTLSVTELLNEKIAIGKEVLKEKEKAYYSLGASRSLKEITDLFKYIGLLAVYLLLGLMIIAAFLGILFFLGAGIFILGTIFSTYFYNEALLPLDPGRDGFYVSWSLVVLASLIALYYIKKAYSLGALRNPLSSYLREFDQKVINNNSSQLDLLSGEISKMKKEIEKWEDEKKEFLLKHAEQIKKPDGNLTSETKECPMCAETIKAKAIICRFCNHKFEPDIIG